MTGKRKRGAISAVAEMVFKAQSAIAKAGDFLTDRFLSKEFAEATNAGADRAVNSIDRATYRAHARLEEERNGWLQGMRLTMVNDLVGTGFKLRVVDPRLTSAERELISQRFHEWANYVKLFRKYRTQAGARIRDGEGLGIFFEVKNPEALERFQNPVKWSYRVVDCDRLDWDALVGSESGEADDEEAKAKGKFVNGIRFDAYGEPIEYKFLKRHPDADSGFTDSDLETFDARQVVHLFDQQRPEQTRGYSAYASVLNSAAMLRLYARAVVKAAVNSARMWGTVKTNLPPVEEEDDNGDVVCNRVDPFETIPIGDDELVFLPEGYEQDLADPKHPTSTHGTFSRATLNEVGRPIGLPLNKATGNSSDYNYASGRMDHQDHSRNVKVIRTDDEHELAAAWSERPTAWVPKGKEAESYEFN